MEVVPERITPWLILVTTAIGTTVAVSGVFFWVRRRLTALFVEAVLEIVSPLFETVEHIKEEQIEVKTQLVRQSRERKREVDKQFVEVHTSIKMLEAKVTKSLESTS